MKRSCGRFCVFFLLLICVFAGCDKIPFLSKYFPSPQKTTPPAAVTTPAIPDTTGPVLAKVGNWTLTREDFQEKLNTLKALFPEEIDVTDPQTKKDILEELIRQELLVQDAESRGIAGEKEIREAIDNSRRTIL